MRVIRYNNKEILVLQVLRLPINQRRNKKRTQQTAWRREVRSIESIFRYGLHVMSASRVSIGCLFNQQFGQNSIEASQRTSNNHFCLKMSRIHFSFWLIWVAYWIFDGIFFYFDIHLTFEAEHSFQIFLAPKRRFWQTIFACFLFTEYHVGRGERERLPNTFFNLFRAHLICAALHHCLVVGRMCSRVSVDPSYYFN